MASGMLVGAAMSVVASLEVVTGMQMVFLERHDEDPATFYDAMCETICDATNQEFCADDFWWLKDTTNPAGFSTLIEYESPLGGDAEICAILPPADYLDPSHAATAISGGGFYSEADQPSKDETAAWLTMMWAAECLNQGENRADIKVQRSDAFATMALALIQGDPTFARYQLETPARKFAFLRNQETSGTAVNLAERILLDVWKEEAAVALEEESCQSDVVNSVVQNVPSIPRAATAPACFTATDTGSIVNTQTVPVTDSNLHVWMWGDVGNSPLGPNAVANPVVGGPPQPWTPFKNFESTDAAVDYIWKTAGDISGAGAQ